MSLCFTHTLRQSTTTGGRQEGNKQEGDVINDKRHNLDDLDDYSSFVNFNLISSKLVLNNE